MKYMIPFIWAVLSYTAYAPAYTETYYSIVGSDSIGIVLKDTTTTSGTGTVYDTTRVYFNTTSASAVQVPVAVRGFNLNKCDSIFIYRDSSISDNILKSIALTTIPTTYFLNFTSNGINTFNSLVVLSKIHQGVAGSSGTPIPMSQLYFKYLFYR